MTRLVVISGGLREPSSTRLLADRLAAGVAAALQQDGRPAEVEVVDLRPLARAIADATVTGFAGDELERAFASVAAADGVVAVTPAFNASYAGLFKSFFDVLPQESLRGVPVLIGATGGTERHSLVLDHAMRPLFAYLGAIVAPTGVYAATADFGEEAGLGARIERAGSEFARLLSAYGSKVVRDSWSDDVDLIGSLLAEQVARG